MNFKKNAPTTLELLAGLGMRQVLAEIPFDLRIFNFIGIMEMVGILKGKKDEINIKTFFEYMRFS